MQIRTQKKGEPAFPLPAFSCAGLLFSPVFAPGGHAAPDVALGLVFLQYLLDLVPQRPVIKRQPLGQILVHRGFTDAEFLGGGPHRRAVFYEVKGQLLGPLLQIFFDSLPLPTCALTLHVYAGSDGG